MEAPPEIIWDNIPIHVKRRQNVDDPFNVYDWLTYFHHQRVPPLVSLNIDEFNVFEWLQKFYHPAGLFPKEGDDRYNSLQDRYDIVGEEPSEVITTWDSVDNTLRQYTQPREELRDCPLLPEGQVFTVLLNREMDTNEDWYEGNGWYLAVSVALYGEWQWWYIVKAQHEKFFSLIIGDPAHCRHDLYQRLNAQRGGPHQLNLLDKLRIPHCSVTHPEIQQVTADLYGIYLLVVERYEEILPEPKAPATGSVIFSLSARGVYNAPHRYIRFNRVLNKRPHPNTLTQSYHAMVVEELGEENRISTWNSKFPEITYDATSKFVGIEGLDKASNDGINHPWRRPIGNVPVPSQLTFFWPPTPDRHDLEVALGCRHEGGPGDQDSGPEEWNVQP